MSDKTIMCHNPHDYRGELVCRKCGRIGHTHVPHVPYSCKKYEDESILPTTFEAIVTLRGVPKPTFGAAPLLPTDAKRKYRE